MPDLNILPSAAELLAASDMPTVERLCAAGWRIGIAETPTYRYPVCVATSPRNKVVEMDLGILTMCDDPVKIMRAEIEAWDKEDA